MLTVLGFAVRLAFILAEPGTHPVADETVWVAQGVEVLTSPEVAFSPFRFRFIFHPPLYPYFLGACTALFGSLGAAKIAQAAVGALLVPAVGRLGDAAFGPRAGILAAGITAVYPELVWFAAHFWSEILLLTVFYWALERVAAAERASSTAIAVAAGLLWGASVLTRETVLYFAPFAAFFLAWRRPGGGRRAAAFLLAMVLVVAPWTYRNWRVFGAFVPVSTAGALNLWQGNATLTREEVYERYWAVRGRIAKYEFARAQGIAAIRERQPLWIFEKLRDEMPHFWEADSQALVHMRRGAYDVAVRFPAALAATIVVLVPYFAVLAGFVVGLLAFPRERLPLLLLGFLVFSNALHVATHGYARYRLPVLPVMFMVAGFAWSRMRDPEAPVASPRGRLLAAAAAIVLLVSLVPSLRLLLRPGAIVSEDVRSGVVSPREPAGADEGPER